MFYEALIAALISAQPPEISHEIAQKRGQIEEFTVTWYSAIETCADRCIMADGTKAYVGAAACPRHMPFGTMIRFENGSEYMCHDRTSLKYDGRIDLFAGYEEADYKLAIKNGKQIRKAEVIYP